MVLMLLAGAAVAGETVRRSDANDVESRLDIRSVSARSVEGRLVLSIQTYEGWRCAYLRNGELQDTRSASLRWRIDLDGDLPSEEDGNFDCKDEKILFKVPDRRPLAVSRPDFRTVRIRVPLRWLSGDRSEWRFLADSRADGRYRDQVLFDEVDDSGPLVPFGN